MEFARHTRSGATLEISDTDLLVRADKQLYAAKAGGRNRTAAEE